MMGKPNQGSSSRLLVTACLLVTVLLTACTGQAPAPPEPGTPSTPVPTATAASEVADELVTTVITDAEAMAALIEAVGFTYVHAEALVPRGVDPRRWQPSQADLRRARQADLVLLTGLGLAPALRAELTSAGIDFTPVGDQLDGNLIFMERDQPNPFLWHTPWAAMALVDELRDALVAIRPDVQSLLEDSAERLRLELQTAALEEEERWATFFESNQRPPKLLVPSDRLHPMTQVSGLFGEPYNDSNGTLMMVKMNPFLFIVRYGVAVVFYDEVSGVASAEAIQQIGAKRGFDIRLAGPLASVAPPGEPGPDAFLRMWRHNHRILREGITEDLDEPDADSGTPTEAPLTTEEVPE